MLKNIRKILVREPNWLGDAIMTLPAISGLKKGFPDAEIDIVIKPRLIDIFLKNPMIHNIISYEPEKKHRGIINRVKFYNNLMRKKYDMALLFQNAFDAALMSFLAGVPIRIGYPTDGRGFLLTHKIPLNENVRKLHQRDYFTNIIKEIGLQHVNIIPEICISDTDKKVSEKLLHQSGIKEDTGLIAIAPGAAYGTSKQWLYQRYAELADMLQEKGKGIIIIGTAGEFEIAKKMMDSMKTKPVNLTGRTSLGGLIGIMKRLDAMICNDSGAMHLAACLDVPLICIFGATDPGRTSPSGNKNIIIYKKVECSPCKYRVCPYDHECMKAIEVEDVFKSTIKVLERYARSS